MFSCERPSCFLCFEISTFKHPRFKSSILENPNLKAQVLEVHILNIQVSNKGHVFESVNLIWVDETIKGPQELKRSHDELK